MTVPRSDCFFLTSANSLLAKFIKVPPPPSAHSSERTKANAKVHFTSPVSNTVRGYRIEIPVYQPITTAADTVSWDKSHRSPSPGAASSGYHYHWTYNKVPQYEVPVLEYQSVTWPSSPSSELSSITDHLPASVLEDQSSWPTTNSATISPVTASSYQYPIYLPSPSSVSKRGPSTGAGLYLIGKSKDFLIPPANSKPKAGQLPLSLIALNSGSDVASSSTASSPQELLSMSEDRRYEVRHGPGQFNKHYYDDQKTFFHQQTDHVHSSHDPFAETRTYEHFQHENNPESEQNQYFSRHAHHQAPSSNSMLEQYPYYMEDSYDNLASLLDTSEGTSQQVRQHKQQQNNNNNNNKQPNWPYKSKYEPINQLQRNTNPKQTNLSLLLGKGENCTQNKNSSMSKSLKNGEQASLYQPVGSSHSEYFESIRKRSGSSEKVTKSNNLPMGGVKSTSLPTQQPIQDNLITANSVKRQTKIKMDQLKDKSRGDMGHQEEDENGSEYDKHKSGLQEKTLNGVDKYETRNEQMDSTADSPKDNYEKEREQWLKDKGYAKHGWKNVYHKEEWGEAKKYHDVWR